MNKKIKVIELLNKIANNEKLPVKIMFNTVAWELMEDEKDYRSTHTKERLLNDDNWILRHLNVEVEILEDEEEIDIQGIEEPEIKSDGLTEYYEYYNGGYTESGYTKNYSLDDIQTRKIIKQLIRAVKQLDKKINKED